MLKKLLLGLALPLFCLALLYGCSASNSSSSATTTTTSSGGTTTTLPTGTNTISGKVSWSAATSGASVCDVLVFTTPDLTGSSYNVSFNVASGQKSVPYTTSGLPNGTYYLVAIIYDGVTSSPGKPRKNDVVGEYSDGLTPSSQSKYFSPSTGSPQAVTVSGSGAGSKDFLLKAVCINPIP
jgi:hypothetical protein